MKLVEMLLKDVYIIEPSVFNDHRGYFMESYNKQLLEQHIGLKRTFVQDNHSLSVQNGTIRGLHYQLHPKSQTKIISVLSGAIYDVVVDLRKSSPTFGQWTSVILNAENKLQLFVPTGFAHGFCTLVPNTQVFYKVDEYYYPEYERGILWNDPDLAIAWPLANPILSEKDAILPRFKDSSHNFV